MKLYAPTYYPNFTCIADKCLHSCCIGWEIDVDDDTMQVYDTITEPYGQAIKDSIDREDTPHFRLCADERCPHLDASGLCKIITNLGEGYLCHICREHPRFYNDTNYGKEVGLGMACEEACRLILSNGNYGDMVEIGEIDGEVDLIDFDPLPHREQIYSILSDHSLPYAERLRIIADTHGVSPSDKTDDEWRDLLGSLEYLDEAHRALFSSYASALSSPEGLEIYLERALAYFIYRHGTAAWDEDGFRAAVGFALFCERLIASVANAEGVNDLAGLIEVARMVSEELEYSEENTETLKSEVIS
ncbi:MAG: flagellin lysine-N-methylase [Clostridia bacterium]|nr:flagellin lysine-N-methylase [Clostridia bacterium]MBQ7316238.1 flagellin lysine-N-methylase [Clostridia bacterium]